VTKAKGQSQNKPHDITQQVAPLEDQFYDLDSAVEAFGVQKGQQQTETLTPSFFSKWQVCTKSAIGDFFEVPVWLFEEMGKLFLLLK
jgi:hypothetical protein